ncbi:MAG: hypothetical protein JKY12_06785 [Sneathiella sp.]|nr:hypothetical protein [Sneathiella sp.]
MIDWSAASSPGPKRPTADRCWIAWASKDAAAQVEYFRTRHACMEKLKQLATVTKGNVLFAFDFPFGYPTGSKIGGGRKAAELLSQHLISSENDKNNRFEVGSILNRELSAAPGPFWGHPKSMEFPNLSWSKPPFIHDEFKEWRLVEHHLKTFGHRIMNVWQLLGQGSVGSQTLTGLAALHRFSQIKQVNEKVSFWPFDTHWDKSLAGIILAEVWPSLSDYNSIDHPIKDARQVLACLEGLSQKNKENKISSFFAAPTCLSKEDKMQCEREEGWILGVT